MREVQRQIVNTIVNTRLELGMTQKAFSEHSGISPSTLAAWEQGRRIPRDIETVDQILQRIGKHITLGNQ